MGAQVEKCTVKDFEVAAGLSEMAESSGARPASSSFIASSASDVEFDVGQTSVQCQGLLSKKPFGHKSARWQKRFFLVKEGFLLYYPESECRVFEKSKHFNIHPKGVIPLGGCMVEEGIVGPQKHAIKVTNQNFKGEIWMSADNQEEAERWTKYLREAGKVTWRNAQLGENIIQQLETKSQEMTQEMNTAIEKLTEEASALEVEKGRKAELEALAAKLEEEKKAIEGAAKNLREEKDTAEQELQQTMSAMKAIEEEKETLHQQTTELQATLMTVSKEKELTEAELEERGRAAIQLEQEKKELEETTSTLIGSLTSMEERHRALEEAKEVAITRLQEKELTAIQLEEEKQKILGSAQRLQKEMEQVAQEKDQTESKYKQERSRRIKTERRLRLAEDSLKRLDRALRDSGVQIDLQIETDVKNLRVFFEECIKEEEYESQKLELLRDAVRAKPAYATEARKLSEMDLGAHPVSPDHTKETFDPIPEVVNGTNGVSTQ